jgi:hypothetical protein
MAQEHAPRIHPDNPKWEYSNITVPNDGVTKVVRPDGGSNIVPDEPIIGTLNKLGKEGWELIAAFRPHDSAESTYFLKRRA